MKDNNEIYKILTGISQAMSRSYDGALGKDGKPIKIGLKREVDDPIIQGRLMDGFGVKLFQNILTINYSTEITVQELHDNKFETEIDQRIEDIVKFLKKEYRTVMKSSLKLKKKGNTDIFVQNINRHRNQVNASAKYEVSDLPSYAEQSKDEHREDLDKTIKKFMALGKGGFYNEN